MDKSLYKDTLDFFIKLYPSPPEGNMLRRLHSFVGRICACFKSKSCTVEGLSSKRPDRSSTDKNSILQETKRFFKNKLVDYDAFFLPLAVAVLKRLAASGELVFIIDGSQINKYTVLMVSVRWRDTSLPIIWLLRKGKKGHFPEEMHTELINGLLKIVPSDPDSCRCILLGDGEFDGEKLRDLCTKNDWEFVLRTQKNRNIYFDGEVGKAKDLYPPPGHHHTIVEDCVDGINLVCWHEPKYDEPLFLLTNMELASMACIYYKRRFEIETMFKRMKSQGFNVHKTRMQKKDRIDRLLMVACAAFIFVSQLGAFLLYTFKHEELKHIVPKDRLPKMTFVRLAWTCFKEDMSMARAFFSNISRNLSKFCT